jgi:hypothetical protein
MLRQAVHTLTTVFEIDGREQEKPQRQETGLPAFRPLTERAASLWTNMR